LPYSKSTAKKYSGSTGLGPDHLRSLSRSARALSDGLKKMSTKTPNLPSATTAYYQTGGTISAAQIASHPITISNVTISNAVLPYAKPKKGYWYRINHVVCPLCNDEIIWKSRQYTTKPEKDEKRHTYRAAKCTSCRARS